ncbi:MAG: Prolipoprotein diacylglyceryl transferase [Firmicutes bacterium ADurb.Bin506]|nr:MAG: Prolipoprotein diacylglyceryl transferase [Firmicutes bacterium ADurb.Bin506]
MYPVLFNLGKYPVYSWGLSLALAFVVGTLYATVKGKKKGINPDNIIDIALIACISSIIGARLLHVLLNLKSYLDYPASILQMRDGGLSFFGGLGAGVLGGWLYVKVKKLPVGKIADVAAPAVALGYAIVRIGCLLNGCCYGEPSALPWAIAGGRDDLLRHPAQIYSAIYSLIIFGLLWLVEARKKFDGQVIWSYVGFYAVARFIVEFFRAGVRDYFAPLTATQVACIALAVLAFGYIRVHVSQSATAAAGTRAGAGAGKSTGA